MEETRSRCHAIRTRVGTHTYTVGVESRRLSFRDPSRSVKPITRWDKCPKTPSDKTGREDVTDFTATRNRHRRPSRTRRWCSSSVHSPDLHRTLSSHRPPSPRPGSNEDKKGLSVVTVSVPLTLHGTSPPKGRRRPGPSPPVVKDGVP